MSTLSSEVFWEVEERGLMLLWEVEERGLRLEQPIGLDI